MDYIVPRGRHAKSRRRFMFSTLIVMLVPFLLLFMTVQPAKANTVSPGNAALNWAEVHATGCWYTYGGTNCAQGYDCSGLVSSAIWNADHIWIGRTTYEMLDTYGHGHLMRTWYPQRGDIAFYGPGHVEIVTAWYHQTFGAQEPGTRVGWHEWSGWWQPTEFFRIVW